MLSIKELEDQLNVLNVEQGIPSIEPKSDYDKYINLSFEELQGLFGNNAHHHAFMLQQCALNIQSKSNRLNSKKIYVDSNLNKALSAVYNDYKTYGGYDIVLGKACAEYKEIRDLHELSLFLTMQIEEIKFLSKHVEAMAASIRSMAYRDFKNFKRNDD